MGPMTPKPPETRTVELSDGSVWALGRHPHPNIWVRQSKGGEGWMWPSEAPYLNAEKSHARAPLTASDHRKIADVLDPPEKSND